MKICHLTSVHKADDTRIFFKECISLAEAGYQVILVAPENNSFFRNGVEVIGVGSSGKGRLSRMLLTAFKVFCKALRIKADIYHFHDPELIPWGIVLKLMGKKVIFDVHENISEQITMKDWLPLNKLISRVYHLVDYVSAKLFYLVLAEQSYVNLYKRYTSRYCVVMNMSDLTFFESFKKIDRSGCANEILYVGGVSEERGIDVILKTLEILKKNNIDFFFHCIGPYTEVLMDKIKSSHEFMEIKEYVCFYGKLSLLEAYKISMKCKIGLAVLKPVENYMHSYPTKIFEYMSISMPVITSNFELYRSVIETHYCGICVNPLQPEEIAKAITELINDPERSRQMGINGRNAVEQKYNWEKEKIKLIELYDRLRSEQK